MLLDMALAITILMVLFAVAWPIIGRNTNNAQQMATAMEIANLLKADRVIATRDGLRTVTRVDLAARTVTSTAGRRVYIPDDLAVEITTSQECIEGAQRFSIAFSPSGSSCGGVILLKKNGRAYAVRLNWLSGMVDVIKIPKA